ncbi:uncharacterized protein LOC119648708 [Hermetia illucens]|uniref:uncharacterized protein LOC119648708 n=1 Tax=Hermetia illucens TaxID=343691 RepID=UPI0018CC4143|nr:uncharacterized protein LOC119648708 [Hermetia illucens]
MAKGILIYFVVNILALTARYIFVEADTCDGSGQPFDREANSANCTEFFVCGTTPNVYSTEECHHGTGFNLETKTCSWRTSTGATTCFVQNGPDKCENKPGTILDKMRDQCVPEFTIVELTDGARPDCTLDQTNKNKYGGKFVADPTNCAGYYLCQDGERYKGSCDAKIYNFDPVQQRCTYKENLPCSVEGSSPSTICQGKKAGTFVEDPDICTAYYLCNGGTAGEQHFCKAGLYFDDGKCVSQRPSRCTCEDWSKILSGKFPHAEKNKYWECKDGMRQEKTCMPGTIWSQDDESCVATS